MKTLVLSLLAALAAASVYAERQEVDGVAAVVNGRPVLWSEIRGAVQAQLQELHEHRAELTPLEYGQRLNELLNKGRDALIDRELILDHFDSSPHRLSDVFVDNQIQERIRSQFDGDRERFRSFLETFGMTFHEYREHVRDEMVIGALQQQNAAPPLFLTPTEIEETYLANLDLFTTEGDVVLRTITIAKSEDAGESAEQRQKIDEIREQLAHGTDFGLLARLHSVDHASADGGLRARERKSDIVAALQETAFETPVGELTPVVEGPGFYAIIRVEDRNEDQIAALTDVRARVEMLAMQQKRSEAVKQWVERLRKDANIQLKG